MKTRSAAAVTLMATTLYGCTNHDFESLYTPPTEDAGNALKPASDYFDFNTTTHVNVSVNYGDQNAQTLLMFYTENPMSLSDDGTSLTLEGTPVFTAFTDDNGRYTGRMELPTCVSSVFVYSPYWGAPMLVEAEVKNGEVNVNTAAVSTRAAHEPRLASNLSYKAYKQNFYTLVDWDQYGAVTDYNGIYSDGAFTSAYINGIRRALWGGETKNTNVDNSGYTAATSKTNTSILSTVTDADGTVQTVTSATITVDFLFEAAWFESAFGYYYYPTNACPSSPDNLKKFIIIPNASIAYNAPYGVSGYDFYSSPLAPMQINTAITLLYENEDGTLTTDFPPGYTIGYFMISNGFNSKNGDIQLSGTLHQNKNGSRPSTRILYSNCEWNTNAKKYFISASAPDGTIIYGIEDGEDKSYDDIVFTVTSSPNIAIQEPDRKPLTPVEPTLVTTSGISRTYAYEDIWPSGGDYDMNDVVVQHRCDVELDNQNNVYVVHDYFKPVQLPGSAAKRNAFAVQFGSQTGYARTFPAGSVWEESTGSLIVFSNANAVAGTEFTVTRDFKGFIKKDELETDLSTLNPFIIENFSAGQDNRIEVHLPKQQATSRADQSLINSSQDAYYIDKDGLHPFAVCVPGLEYIPANEGILINKHYPYFTRWVETNGAENADWWKYPVE